MSARDEILGVIRARRIAGMAHPPPYHMPVSDHDLVTAFAERAGAAAAQIRLLDNVNDVPAAVADILRARNLPAMIHTPPDPLFERFEWVTMRDSRPPGPDDAALSLASFAVAETGTLVYPAMDRSPASWHFRAGLEIAILSADAILPRLEDVLGQLKSAGPLPHTINLVTGPSRTADIEQTLELGAHGPKALAILIVPRIEVAST